MAKKRKVRTEDGYGEHFESEDEELNRAEGYGSDPEFASRSVKFADQSKNRTQRVQRPLMKKI